MAILKPLSAAIAIGTGGPFGAEGPIIQTRGAVGSLEGQLFHTTGAERKLLLACGAAAGMSATFNTPVAGVILAIELLLFEFKTWSFIPLVIASTLATTVHMELLGAGPMFRVKALDFAVPRALPFYLVLGGLCGLAAVGFSKLLYRVEDLFDKLSVDELWRPGIGALGLGIIGSSIMSEKLARRGLRIHQDHETDVLQQVQVAETMDRDIPVIVAQTRMRELAERIARHDPGVSRHQARWIVDGTGQLEGVITRGDVTRALPRDQNGAMTVAEAGTRDPVVARRPSLKRS